MVCLDCINLWAITCRKEKQRSTSACCAWLEPITHMPGNCSLYQEKDDTNQEECRQISGLTLRMLLMGMSVKIPAGAPGAALGAGAAAAAVVGAAATACQWKQAFYFICIQRNTTLEEMSCTINVLGSKKKKKNWNIVNTLCCCLPLTVMMFNWKPQLHLQVQPLVEQSHQYLSWWYVHLDQNLGKKNSSM